MIKLPGRFLLALVFWMVLCLPVLALGQTPRFIVYFVSGKCTKDAAGKVFTLKKGDKLYGSEKLSIAAGSKLILVCSNYNTAQVNKAGQYAVSTLYANCIKAKPSFTASYFHFVWDEFIHPHSSPEKEPEKYMKTAGAVTRGKEPVDLLILADTIRYFSGSLSLRYTPASDTVIFTIFKADTRNSLPRTSGKVTGTISFRENLAMGSYRWFLADMQKRRGPVHTLLVLSESEYNKNISALLSKIIPAGAAETAFMRGFILEQHKYLVEAEKYYKLALVLEPKNPVYKQLASRF